MTVLLMLQSDLRSLSVESRSKHPQVKEAAERAILQVRSLKQPEPGSEEGPAAASVGQFELVVRPLTMACKTREPKLALIAVGCLQKLIAQDAIPLESLSAVLATLVDQADTGDEGVQAKILQTVLSLLASRTYPVRRDDLSRAFSICLVLHDQSAASALINNTATATMRQAVSLLFERVVASGGGAGAAAAAAAVAGDNPHRTLAEPPDPAVVQRRKVDPRPRPSRSSRLASSSSSSSSSSSGRPSSAPSLDESAIRHGEDEGDDFCSAPSPLVAPSRGESS